MGIPVVAEALKILAEALRIFLFILGKLWDLIPSKIKLILFLFLVPTIGGLVAGIWLNAGAYVCDTYGDVYQINASAEGIIGMIGGVTSFFPLLGPPIAQSMGAKTPSYAGMDIMRDNIVNFQETRYVSQFYGNIYPCIYPNGTAKPKSTFSPWDQLFTYNVLCVPYAPREGEVLTIQNDSVDGPFDLTYDCTDCDVDRFKEDYNDVVYEYCDPVEVKDMYAQFLPITCTEELKPQVTVLGIPIFDFRVLLLMLVVSVVASYLIPILAMQRR